MPTPLADSPLKLPSATDLKKIGVIAGWGRYPVVVIQSLRQQGYEVYGLGIRGHADADMRPMCRAYREIGLARLGTAIRFFRSHGVTHAVMAGKIHKVVIFRRFSWIRHLPDWKCVRTFFPHFVTQAKDRKDDTLLTAIVEAFAKDGITFLPATDFLPELLVKFGHLAGRSLRNSQRKDIAFGWQIAKELGRLDVGQSVAVKGQAVLALEAIEGTDECIRRAGRLCTSGGFTVVKVAKPQQDMRFDVPTVGVGTLRVLAEAGARCLAVEAEKTIVIDQPQFTEEAARLGICVVAVQPERLNELAEAA